MLHSTLSPHSRFFKTSYSAIKRYIEYCIEVTRATCTVNNDKTYLTLDRILQKNNNKKTKTKAKTWGKIRGELSLPFPLVPDPFTKYLLTRETYALPVTRCCNLYHSVSYKITFSSSANSATSIDNNLFFIAKVPRSLFGLKITLFRAGAVIWVKLWTTPELFSSIAFLAKTNWLNK